jgi:hypothetical protein
MSILEAMKRGNVYMRMANFTLLNKYEPCSGEYFKTTLFLAMTDIDTPWRGTPETGEIYWGCWSRNRYKRGNFLKVFL